MADDPKPLDVQIMDAWKDAPEAIKPVLAAAFVAVQQRDRLASRLRDLSEAAAQAAKFQ